MDTLAFRQLLQEAQTLQLEAGLDMNDLLNISDEMRQLLVWMIRKNGFQLNELENFLGVDPESAQKLLEALRGRGLVEEIQTTQRFQVQMAPAHSGRKYQVPKDVWKVFE